MIEKCNFRIYDKKFCGLISQRQHPYSGENDCMFYNIYLCLVNIKVQNEFKNVILNEKE